MREESRLAEAIARLIELTQAGSLAWRVDDPTPDIAEGKEIVRTVYQASEAGRTLRLYEYRFKDFYDEGAYNWEDSVALEVSDAFRPSSWWRFPNNPMTRDLLDAVKFRTAGVHLFIDGLLKKK